MAEKIDLDRIVDYKAEYTAVIKQWKISGDELNGLCPFHKEKNPSFSANLKTGQWQCFTEGYGGNFISFWAKLNGVDNAQAYKDILKKYAVGGGEPKSRKTKPAQELGPYTLEQFSADKKLPVEFLKEKCRASTGRERNGTAFLKILYCDEYGRETTFRKRFANKEFRWRYGSAGHVCLYGAWMLPRIRQKRWTILVEGESDAQSLWYMGLPALGVAGAAMFKAEQAAALNGLTLYIHKEPDKGGDTFITKVLRELRDGGFSGTVLKWECSLLGVKDPSDLYLAHGRAKGTEMIRSALSKAERLDIEQALTPEVIPGAPVNLRQPPGWAYSEEGISVINKKADETVNICRTPIILTKRLKSLETGEERMEIAFLRDKRWHTAIYPRSTIFSSRKITELADFGCTVTSENARRLVSFLAALEAENIDVIPQDTSTSAFGWKPGRRFLPGHADGITLDIDPTQRNMAAAYRTNGTLENWIAHMAPYRENDKFRFILAAAFAAPLLRIVKQRPFLVYNWGDSKGGKTAAMKAGLSVWGDPERLMVSFNATQVALERTAALCCDLPLGVDERQLSTRDDDLFRKVYMLSSGSGRQRGNKTGGLQNTSQWRSIILATGEEPIAKETTMTGISTRALEIYGGPFSDEQEASLMHQKTASDYGWAGPVFMEKIIAMDDKSIEASYEQMREVVQSMSKGKNGAHISGVSVIALADAMINCIFFSGEHGAAWDRAQAMAENILLGQVENNASDVNENAVQFVTDWVMANKTYFCDEVKGTRLGFIDEGDDSTVYIFPSMLNRALTEAGFSTRKTMRHMAEQGLIGLGPDKKYSVVKRFGGKTARYVEFHMDQVIEDKNPSAGASYQTDFIDLDEAPPLPFD